MIVQKKWFVPFSKLTYTQEMIDAAVTVLQRGATSVGEGGEEGFYFEKEFAYKFGQKNGISLSSGSAALHLALLACGVNQGDEVIVPPNTCLSVPSAVTHVGAKPTFVDAEYETQNLDPLKLEEQITSKTKAVIVVHTQGHPCDMDPIMEIAEKYDLKIIENAIHAAGSKYKGKKLPITSISVFGFHHSKSLYLPAPGGGMILTNNEEIANDARLRRYHGIDENSGSDRSYRVGFNYRMSEVAAAIGRVQLRHLDEYTAHQRETAKYYDELLTDIPPVTPPVEKDYAYHTFLRYVILVPKRDQLKEYLARQSIQSKVLYDIPLHLDPRYMKTYGTMIGDYPITEKIKEEELALPMPRFRERWEIEYIAEKIKTFYTSL